ncbi:MAG TPA: hypothetical protein VHD56_12885 [Tepidisphaeraceae bacterium]|nr:hypothetical protein [Tepidisphaeraceae bacterium]
MKHLNPQKAVLICLLAGLVAGFTGCFASKYTLVPPEQAKVDRKYVGDWDAINTKGDHVTFIIRNIDDKLFTIQTRDQENKGDSYVGFLADVKGTTFAEVRELPEDGTIHDEWMLMKISLVDGKLLLDQLDQDKMKNVQIASSQQLRAFLEEHLNDPAIYAKDEFIAATRIVARQ